MRDSGFVETEIIGVGATACGDQQMGPADNGFSAGAIQGGGDSRAALRNAYTFRV